MSAKPWLSSWTTSIGSSRIRVSFGTRRRSDLLVGEAEDQQPPARSIHQINAARQMASADARTLTDRSLAHTEKNLQIKLPAGFGGNELHGRTLHRLGSRLGVAELALLAFRVRAHIFGRHQSSIVAQVRAISD